MHAGKEFHFILICGFIDQKGVEYPDGYLRKKYKHRVVLRTTTSRINRLRSPYFEKWQRPRLCWRFHVVVTHWASWKGTQQKAEPSIRFTLWRKRQVWRLTSCYPPRYVPQPCGSCEGRYCCSKEHYTGIHWRVPFGNTIVQHDEDIMIFNEKVI